MNLNPFEVVQAQIDEAAIVLQLDPTAHAFIRKPMREVTVTLPVKMDDGSTRIFTGHRVQYNNARGPFMGGLRMHPHESIDTCRALAAWMTWKLAAQGLPLGGAKGLINCNPRDLSRGELERLSRAYVRMLSPVIGDRRDTISVDVSTNPMIMAWIADEYSTIKECYAPGVAIHSTSSRGGPVGYQEAWARGCLYCIREAAGVLRMATAGATAAIQGYGNLGSSTHKLADGILGMKVVAVSDEFGGIYSQKGLDYDEVNSYVARNGKVEGFPAAESISNADLLTADVDVLIPAAIENQITSGNADQVKAKIVAELANGPTMPEAEGILSENGVFVIPDLLCNAGGIICAYLETVQHSQNLVWNRERVFSFIDRKITESFRQMFEIAEQRGAKTRTAAYLLAIQNVVDACYERGWI